MRTVSRYSLVAEVTGDRDGLQDYLNLVDRAEAWIQAKGEIVENRLPDEVLRFADGREAEVTRTEIDVGVGGLRELAIVEPIEGAALFETRLSIGLHGRSVAVYCDLRVGGRHQPLGPVRFDASCPRIIRDFVSYDLPWVYGDFAIPKGVRRFRGSDGGKTFAELLTDQRRLLPIVTVAEYQGFVLHPGIADSISRDLASLAIVAELDEGAAWRLTQTLGADWSCYNGAIRLYWPGLKTDGEVRAHPLWTARRLMENVPNTTAAADRIRRILRRQIMAASAFAIREPEMFDEIRNEDRTRRFAAEREKYKADQDFVALAESCAKEADELRAALTARDEEMEGLRAQVQNLQLALRWREAEPEEEDVLEPETVAPPATVEAAVQRAKQLNSDALDFGPSVTGGIEGLAPDAGPPDKVLSYLNQLGELSRARASGTLGTSMLEWFKQHNVSASTEGQGVQRMWGGREYEWHLKPAEAVSPDRCVRIYFDWDDDSRKIIVGWVGRHP